MKTHKLLLILIILSQACSTKDHIDLSEYNKLLEENRIKKIELKASKKTKIYTRQDSGVTNTFFLDKSYFEFINNQLPELSAKGIISDTSERNPGIKQGIFFLTPWLAFGLCILLFFLFLLISIRLILKNLKPNWITGKLNNNINKFESGELKLKDIIHSFPVKSGNKVILIHIEDIIDFSSVNNHVLLTDIDSKEFLTESNLKDLEKKLPNYFIRIHRSSIINTKQIKEIKSAGDGKYEIIMSDILSKKLSCSKFYNDKIKELMVP